MSLLPERVLLVARDPALVAAWREVFEGFEAVEPTLDDYFAHDADCMLSPANSFGIMDGGLDLAIRDALGFGVENVVQRFIVEHHHGECPVGQSFVVPTKHERWPFLAVAPTMRVPEPLPHSINAYLAFRAALLAIARHNAEADRRGEGRIRTLLCPGLCTGVGQMAPRRSAAQMRVAWVHASKPARIPSFDEIHRVHLALRTAG